MPDTHLLPLPVSRPAPHRLAFATALLSLLLYLAIAPASQAEMCAIDVVPAATLLLPYFEVDLNGLDDPASLKTLFSINNAVPEATIVHVTFWTDYSLPTLDFDIFLTGYDVQVVDLADVFAGNLPVTADAQTDPSDTISPHWLNPEWDGSFPAAPNCANFFPFSNPVLPSQNLDRLVNGHTGQPVGVLGGECSGSNTGGNDNIARGYITMDDAVRCSIEFPSDPGYFGGADPVASNDNQLWGDFVIQHAAEGFTARDSLVHIEADPNFDGATTSNGYTFYGTYTGGADNREPLSSTWGARYFGGGQEAVTTDLIVWRDATADMDPSGSFECASETPAWFPLQQSSVLCFDEQETFVETCNGPGDECFPLVSQRVTVDSGDFRTPFDSGWCLLDLRHDDSFPGDVDFPSPGSPLVQSYVTTLYDQGVGFASASRAVSLDSACTLPAGFADIFEDGFETGGLTNWSASQP